MIADRKEKSASEPQLNEPAAHNHTRSLKWVTSYVLIACIGFVAIELFNRLRPHDITASADKSAIWWAVKNWRAQTRKPDIVLLGSSLMMAAQNDCDATYFNQSFDALLHYHSMYLESILSKTTPDISSASFVIGGQMPSDAYAIVSMIYQRADLSSRINHHKQTIVWGVAPRDFIDATFGNPEDTETVRLMNRITDRSNILNLEKIPAWSKVENAFATACSLYRQRNEIRASQRDSLEKCLALPSQNQPPSWLLHQASLSFPEDNRLGQWIVRPFNKKGDEPRDNNAEYKSRYNPFKASTFEQQFHYFDKTIDTAVANGDQVLIVNMPLTAGNMRWLPEGVYERYVSNLGKHTLAHGAKLLDLNKGQFLDSEFWDPVHLNGYGARKFMDAVAAALSNKI